MASVKSIPDEDRNRPLWLAGTALVLLVALAPAFYRLFLKPTVEARAEAGQVVLRYMAWGQPQQLNIEREIIGRFNQKCRNEGRKLRVELFMPPAAGYPQKMRMMLASNDAPDIMRVDHYDFPSLVPKGCFYDLTDLAKNDPDFDAADFHPSAMRENMYQGRLFGLNVLFGGPNLYYNKDLFAQALVPEPYDLWKRGEWTWEKFEEVARLLTKRDDKGRTTQFGFLLPAWGGQGSVPNWSWFQWTWIQGGDLLSPDMKTSLLDSPQCIDAMQRFRDMRWKWGVAPTPADAAASAFSFESGNIAMEFNYMNGVSRYRDSVKDFAWDIAPTPCDPKKPIQLVKGNQLVVFAGTKHPKEAWEWVKYMTSRDTERLLCGDTLRRCVPTRRSVLSSQEFLHAARPPYNTDIWGYMLDHAKELPIDSTWPAWTNECQNFVDLLFMNEHITAAEVMPKAKAAIDEVLVKERARMERYLSRRVEGAHDQ